MIKPLFMNKTLILVAVCFMSVNPLIAQVEDVTPPDLVDVWVSTSQVDTSLSSQSVLVTRKMSDDLSGVAYSGAGCTGYVSGLVFRSPSGAQTVKLNNCSFNLTSGTDFNGEFTASATFPQYSESGVWLLHSMIIEDQAGNSSTLYSNDFSSLGISTSIEVTSPGDLTAPLLTSVSVSPGQIDTSLSLQAVEVVRSMTDDLSGVAYQSAGCTGFTNGMVFQSPSGAQTVKIGNCSFQLDSGSPLNGSFSATAYFPQFSEVGDWELVTAMVEDQAGNYTTLNSASLSALGISATVEVTSPGDTSPPVLTSVVIQPQVIDTSDSAAVVQVTRSLIDDISGVAYQGAGCTGFVSGLVFTSPTGAQQVKINNCSFSLVVGSDLSGDFSGAAHFPQYSEVGIWPLTSMIIEDQAGNTDTLSATDLAAIGINAYVEVLPGTPELSCSGFEPPMAEHPVKAKRNRAFPLKMQLFDVDGLEVTDADVIAVPLVEVMFTEAGGQTAVDVTGDLLSVGLGSEGNQFVYTDDGQWQFNLKAENYTGSGTYVVTAVSGASDEYAIDPSCVTSFEVM